MPILGGIPLLGALFRAQKTESLKTNLMVFIRPKILRDSAQSRFETNTKYNAIRESLGNDRIRLMPGMDRTELPPFEEVAEPLDNTSDDNGSE